MSFDDIRERVREGRNKVRDHVSEPVHAPRMFFYTAGYFCFVGGLVLGSETMRHKWIKSTKGAGQLMLTKAMLDNMRETEKPISYITHEGEEIAIIMADQVRKLLEQKP